MNKTLPLPLFEMPDGSVADLRYLWGVEEVQESCDGDGAWFKVYYTIGSYTNTFLGEKKWLFLERDNLIKQWTKIAVSKRQGM